MRWYECSIIHLVLYGIIQYYIAQSAKIPIIQTHSPVPMSHNGLQEYLPLAH